jgi:hypothetical protein
MDQTFINGFKSIPQGELMSLLDDQIHMLTLNAQELAETLKAGQGTLATHAAVDRTAGDAQDLLAEVYSGELEAKALEPLVTALRSINEDLLPEYAAANLHNAINMYAAVEQNYLDVA